jgi:hypothetical protein
MKLRDAVEKLSTEELKQIVADWDQFEKDGAIGDCALRLFAQNFLKDAGIPKERITWWMKEVTFEALRVWISRLRREVVGQMLG